MLLQCLCTGLMKDCISPFQSNQLFAELRLSNRQAPVETGYFQLLLILNLCFPQYKCNINIAKCKIYIAYFMNIEIIHRF